MSTVAKAVSLLEVLGQGEPERTLADLARSADFDKATTRRLLLALMDQGLVEQDGGSRLYRLGIGVARLALMREAQFPFLRTAVPLAEALAAKTGETVHFSEHSSRGLISVHVVESSKANRVAVPIGETLPLHATASGIAFMAFADRRIMEAALGARLASYTPHTVTNPAAIRDLVSAARARGYSIGAQGYEDGVFSVAAPILGSRGTAVGALAIAAPRARIEPADTESLGTAVVETAFQISERLTGRRAKIANE
ncbi:IclR family transcriptional regulator [Mesorhizobium sp. 1M-11]|uniref:IclR family transcriptional regulator n=1 Tax=Mesorhizobium sp. 1M-11 TaxID=1529006 RepID=UPI0006C7371A|nr:IclR family transcriptional regulator [Mesorhizobium sp. 1M-11]